MKGDAWEGGHRMPFLVRWPARVQPGSVTDQTICFTDLLATLAGIVGEELPAGAGPDSFDFSRVLDGTQRRDSPVRNHLVLNSANGTMIIRHESWKLIAGLGSGGFSEPQRVEPKAGGPLGQLYDLANDLGERTNLYQERPEIVNELNQELLRTLKGESSRAMSDR